MNEQTDRYPNPTADLGDYEIHTGRVSASPHFGWKGYLLHTPSDTIVDEAYGTDEATVRRLMRRRRFERTRSPITPVSFYGSGTVHLAFVDPETETVPYSPIEEGPEVEPQWRAVHRKFEGSSLCGIPLTPRTVLTNAAPNCMTCQRLHETLRQQGVA